MFLMFNWVRFHLLEAPQASTPTWSGTLWLAAHSLALVKFRQLFGKPTGTRVLKEPLTHHQIIHIAAAFAERGHVLDLARSCRKTRRLVFKPHLHDNVADGFRIKECLILENPWPGTYRLSRDLVLPNGLVSRLAVSGPEPLDLLRTAEAIPLERGFVFGTGFILAKNHAHEPFGWSSFPVEGDDRLVLKGAVAKVAGLTILFDMPEVAGYPAQVRITNSATEAVDLPDDLLAVLGGDWRRLEAIDGGWSTTMRVRGREPQRCARSEANVERAISHVAQTLMQPPRRFHEERTLSRWWVQIRNTIPLFFWALVTLAILHLSFVSTSWVAVALAAAPFIAFLLLGLPFLEWSKLSLPQRPRRLIAASWWHPADDRDRSPAAKPSL
jgi:hypothetical protein